MGGDCATKLTITRQIKTSPEKIFAFVISDRVNEVWEEWMGGRWTSEGPVGIGSVAHFKTSGLLKSFGELTGEVTEFEENKKITLCSRDAEGRTIVTDTMILEPLVNGTNATYVTDYRLPYSIFGMLVDKAMLNNEMKKMHTRMLENLKRVLEAQS